MDRFDPRAFLREHGHSDEEIDAATEGGWLVLLVLDHVVLPGVRAYNRVQAASRAGVPAELATRFWRAMGFPDVPEHATVFTDADVAALKVAADRIAERGDPERALQQARVVASSMSRIAELWTDDLARMLEELRQAGLSEDEVIAVLVDRLDLDLAPAIFDFVHRRQLQSSIWRRFGVFSGMEHLEQPLAVGFCDLVGYTALSQQLTADELTELVGRFEALTHDTIAAMGGRVIKRIGDAVMFSIEDPQQAAELGLRLIEELAELELLARVGIAAGPVVLLQGDLFGPVVNLASRIVSMARPSAVVISEGVRDALGPDRFKVRGLGRRYVKDMGFQRLWAVRRPKISEPSGSPAEPAEGAA